MTDLDQQMRQVLAELELLPHGKCASYNSSGGGDSASDLDWREVTEDDLDAIIKAGTPQGESRPPHLIYRERYERAKEDDLDDEQIGVHRRAKVIAAARRALMEVRTQTKRVEIKPETDAQFTARIIKEGEGWSIKDTANYMKCTETRVRRARTEVGVSQADGKRLIPLANLTVDKRRVMAQELRGKRMTLRQIAMHLGCDAETIRRDLAA